MQIRSLWRVTRRAAQDWWEDNCLRLAASLAYYTALSLAPLLLLIVGLLGVVLGRAQVASQLAAQLESLMGPAGLPGDIVMRLNREVNAALQRAEVQNWLSAQGMEPAGGSAEQFAARIRNDLDAMAKVIRDAGLRMN